MKFVGDFHIHSHYSLATSKELRPGFLEYFARLKGIKVVGTGDFTHPRWVEELKEQLEPAEKGLFKVKHEFQREIDFPAGEEVRFILTAEISNIYKKKGKIRKVHNVLFAPSFEVVDEIQSKLQNLGYNITSDGRPILGMDSRDLLELALEASEEAFFVPAHIWTPWFSVLGSKSGFDTIQECFEDLSQHIHAVETGLSTDPPMNWMCSFLDPYVLISNSDAHSPEKLGRNANIFNTELSYDGIVDAMKLENSDRFLGTIDFFPQEGKYHYDGHRKCGICWSPLDTLQHDEVCPVCGRKITVGVMNRIAQLADRDDVLERKNRHPFYSLIPLKEILSEMEGVSPDSKKVNKRYMQLIRKAGSEFNILLHNDLDDVKTIGGEVLSEAIRRMRNREVHIKEGFDGEFGIIRVFLEGESDNYLHSASLFEESKEEYSTQNPLPLVSFNLKAFRKLNRPETEIPAGPLKEPGSVTDYQEDHGIGSELNAEQSKAAGHERGPAMILAGPGTGKTKVLTTRIAYLIKEKEVKPESILAITFTNKAAQEMKTRLSLLMESQHMDQLTILTFHAFGLSVIKKFRKASGSDKTLSVIDEEDKKQILAGLDLDQSKIAGISEKITEIKQSLRDENDIKDKTLAATFVKYNHTLRSLRAFDFDDLIGYPVQLFMKHPDFLEEYRRKYEWLLVDEYQDINYAQYRLICMLMPDKDSNLFAIGDPDQAIYGFRGASAQYIQRFKDHYQSEVYTLKKSYRCSGFILRASDSVLKENPKFLEGLQMGVKIKISENATDKSEAEYIARTIEKMIGGMGFFSIDSKVAEGNKEKEIESLSDFAVLCRIGKQMPAIEKALRDHNIPFQKVGDTPFFRQKQAREMLDIYRFTANPGNILLRSRILKQSGMTENKLRQIIDMLSGKTLSNKLKDIIHSRSPGDVEKQKFLYKRLVEMAEKYEEDEEDFLQHIVLGTGIDTWKPMAEAVNLMTIHSSKGLEFNCVFISGCEDNLIPYSLFPDTAADPEEERRLLYVGMTRAKHFLLLTHARSRFIMGKEYHQERSRFINQIEQELLETEKQTIKKKEKAGDEQLSLF